MDWSPLNYYDRWGIIKHQIYVENVPEVVWTWNIK